MRGWAILLLIFGVGSFIIPMFNIQFSVVQIFGDYQIPAGIALAVFGVVLLVAPMFRTKTPTG